MLTPKEYEDLETFLWIKGTSFEEYFYWLKEKDSGVYQQWAVDKLGDSNEEEVY